MKKLIRDGSSRRDRLFTKRLSLHDSLYILSLSSIYYPESQSYIMQSLSCLLYFENWIGVSGLYMPLGLMWCRISQAHKPSLTQCMSHLAEEYRLELKHSRYGKEHSWVVRHKRRARKDLVATGCIKFKETPTYGIPTPLHCIRYSQFLGSGFYWGCRLQKNASQNLTEAPISC
jgi:hypothetical protein